MIIFYQLEHYLKSGNLRVADKTERRAFHFVPPTHTTNSVVISNLESTRVHFIIIRSWSCLKSRVARSHLHQGAADFT